MGYYGNSPASAAAVAEAKAAQAEWAEMGENLRAGGAYLSFLGGVYDVGEGGGSGRSFAEASVGLLIGATAFIPIAGPVVALTLSVVNMAGGFNWFYNMFDNTPLWGRKLTPQPC